VEVFLERARPGCQPQARRGERRVAAIRDECEAVAGAVPTGGLKDQGDGWDNTLELKVRTVRVEPLG
jgi:hypothetical protein